MATNGATGRMVAGRYRLDRLIGRGGAGAVWRGQDERLHRPVAVKEISYPTDGPQAEIGKVRALREARAAARLGDAGVVQIYDIVEEWDGAYLIMELVAAPNLSVLIRRAGPMRPGAVAALGIRMLDSLVAAHRAGIVHRDIKPSNVLIDGDTPRLTDFGIARLGDDATITSSGVVMGTPAYIAPEHARGEPVGPAADLYGLGATLYYAVEGTAPFGEGTSVATVMAVLDRPPRPPRRAGPLAPVLDELLVKDPRGRPAAGEVRHRLVAVRDGTPEPAVVPPTTAQAQGAPGAAVVATDDTDEISHEDLSGGAPDGVTSGATSGALADATADVSAAAPADRRQATPPARQRNRRRPVAVAVLASVVVTLLAALGLRPGGGDQPRDDVQVQAAGGAVAAASPSAGAPAVIDRAAPSTATPSATLSPSPSDPVDGDGVLPAHDVDVPADWVVFASDDAPYRVAHPPDWQIIDLGDTRTDIRDPSTGTYLRLDWVAARRDPVIAWETFEPSFAARQEDFRRLRLEPTTYRGEPAALWEYRYRSGGADLHAYNLGVSAGDRGFALNLQARQQNFAAARRLWPYFLASYEFNGR